MSNEQDKQHLQELAAYRFTVENLRARVAELEAQLVAAPQAVPGVGELYALQEAEAALELAIHRILKRDPGHAVHVTSEAKALVAVRAALDTAAPAHPADGAPAQEVQSAIYRFDAYFRSANGVPPNARVSVPTAEWQELRAMLSTHPTQQGLDAKHELRKAIERLAAATFKDEAARSPLGRFAVSTCAASLPIAFGAESFVTALEAQKMLDAALAAKAKQGCA